VRTAHAEVHPAQRLRSLTGVTNHLRNASGFSLIEVAVVVLILGLLFGFSVPTFRSYRQSQMLEAATQNLVGQLRLGRQKAIGMQHEQRLTFSVGTNKYAVEDVVTGQSFGPFEFTNGIVLEQANIVVAGVTGSTITALTDGRYSGSGEFVLRDSKGLRDTVSVQASGLAVSR
jgi:prepilin-type N-terminal cleavage/methylation domain-containing protein